MKVYRNKLTKKDYVINSIAVCQDRNVEVVIYTEYSEEEENVINNLFSMEKEKFFKEHELEKEIGLYTCSFTYTSENVMIN